MAIVLSDVLDLLDDASVPFTEQQRLVENAKTYVTQLYEVRETSLRLASALEASNGSVEAAAVVRMTLVELRAKLDALLHLESSE